MLENRELVSLALHGAQVGMWEFDPATGENRWDESMAAVMGIETYRASRGGGDFLAFVHPDDRAGILAAFDEALRSGKEGVVWQADFRAIRPDGTQRWINTRGTLVRRDGSLLLMGIAQDITARKEVEEQLRESEARFRLIADSAPVLIWMVDGASVTFLNRAYYEFVGMPPDTDPRAIDWEGYIHPDDRDAYVAAWREAAARGESFEGEMRLRRKDGGYRWVRSMGMPRFDASGALTGYSGVSLDVHGARQALEALGEADRRKDRFLATLAHELRNPLAPIRTGVQLLRHLDLGEAVAPTLEMMQRQIAVMAHLLDDLLDVGRISRGKLSLQRRFVTLGDVVRLAVEAARTEITDRDHELAVSIADDSLTLNVDPVRIAQVLTNLLNNAARYTPAGGQIELTAGRGDGAVAIAVSDNGRGLSPEDVAELFSPFSRISGGEGGLGLGLTLARTLVEMHGGTLTASSEGAGRGSRFVVRLPL